MSTHMQRTVYPDAMEGKDDLEEDNQQQVDEEDI